MILGLVNGGLVLGFKIPSIIATLATLSILNGISLTLRDTPPAMIDRDFTKLLSARVGGQDATVVRPKLIEAFNDIREYGIAIDKLIDIHERVLPLVDQISGDPRAGGCRGCAATVIKPGEALPTDTEVAELITMLGTVPNSGRGRGHRDAGLLDRVDDRGGWSVRYSPISSRRQPTPTQREPLRLTPTRWCPAACW